MKKYTKFFAAALAIVAAVSCQEEINTTPELIVKSEKTFSVSIDAVQTKTDITIEGGKGKVSWVVGDQVTIFDGASNATVTLTEANINEEDATQATFTATVAEASEYYAIYPASEAATFNAALVSTLSQSGSFADASVMAAVSTGESLSFKNVFGLVKFETAKTDVKIIKFQGNDSEKVSGQFAIAFDSEGNVSTDCKSDGSSVNVAVNNLAGTYYIALPSVTLSSGFTMTLYSDESATVVAGEVVASKAMLMEAGKIINLGAIDGHVAHYIRNAEELQAFLTYAPNAVAGETWYIANDIDLQDVTITSAESFAGTLDGQNHSLKNWNCTAPLFAVTDSTSKTSVIKNIVIDATSSIHPTQGKFGAIASRAYGYIENCVNNASATVTDNNYSQYVCGGLVGRLEGKMKDCVNNGNFTFNFHADARPEEPNSYIGGLVGFVGNPQASVDYNADNVRFNNCRNTGNLTVSSSETSYLEDGNQSTVGHMFLGGVFGATTANTPSGTETTGYAKNYGVVRACSNSGAVAFNHPGGGSACYASIGGVAGYTEAYLESCTNSGAVSFANSNERLTAKPYVGGITGAVAISAKDCTNSGKITATGMFGGGSSATAITAVGAGYPSVGGCFGVVGVDAATDIVNCDNSGDVTTNATMTATAGSIYSFGGVVGFVISTTHGLKDCDNTGKTSFTSSSKSSDYGGVVARSKAPVDNCTNAGACEWSALCPASSGKVTERICNAGGIVGYAYSGVTNCENKASGTITLKANGGTRFAGVVGMLGAGTSPVVGCINRAVLTAEKVNLNNEATNLYSGGVVGCLNVNTTAQKCHNYGNITSTLHSASAKSYFGGVVGYTVGTGVSESTNSGNVTAEVNSNTNQMFVGGILGCDYVANDTTRECIVTKSENSGNISLTGSACASAFVYIGGVHGGYAAASASGTKKAGTAKPTVTYCTNSGNVYSDNASKMRAGGVSGALNTSFNNNTQAAASTVTVKNCTAGSCIGLLAGYCSATTLDGCKCYGKLITEGTTSSYVGIITGYSGVARTWSNIEIDATVQTEKSLTEVGYFAGYLAKNLILGTDDAPVTFASTTAINGTPIPSNPADTDLCPVVASGITTTLTNVVVE